MVGHVSTTVNPEHLDAALLELFFTQQQVRSLSAPAKGVGVRVLEQQQGGWSLTPGDLPGNLVLQIPGLLVGYRSEPTDMTCLHEASITSVKIVLRMPGECKIPARQHYWTVPISGIGWLNFSGWGQPNRLSRVTTRTAATRTITPIVGSVTP